MPSMIKVAENKCCRWENRKSNFHLPPEIYLCIFNDFLFWRKKTDKIFSSYTRVPCVFSSAKLFLNCNRDQSTCTNQARLVPLRSKMRTKWYLNIFLQRKPSAVFDNNWSIGNRHLKEGGVIEMIETNHLVFIFFYATLPPLCFFEYYFDLNSIRIPRSISRDIGCEIHLLDLFYISVILVLDLCGLSQNLWKPLSNNLWIFWP